MPKEYYYEWRCKDGKGVGFAEGAPRDVANTAVRHARAITNDRITVLLWRPTAVYDVQEGSHTLEVLPIPKKINE